MIDGFDLTLEGLLVLMATIAVCTNIWYAGYRIVFMRWLERQPWWPHAAPLQKALCLNYGYDEQDCTPEAMLDTYTWVFFNCTHHMTMGICTLPVCFMGWEGAGEVGRTLFVGGCLLDSGSELQDFFRTFSVVFFRGPKCLGEPASVKFFIVAALLHHPLSIGMIVPMLWNYGTLPAFHYVVASLLLAGGSSFAMGCYKFTLDTATPSGFGQYKMIVFLQLIIILSTRCIIWFPQIWILLNKFSDDGETVFLIGGGIASVLMSFFNIALMSDAIGAAIKWLPRKMPTTTEGKQEVKQQILRSVSLQLRINSSNKVGDPGLTAGEEKDIEI